MDNALDVTRHAIRRCRERGFRRRDITRLVDMADQWVSIGNRCTSLWLSQEGVADLLADGWPPAEVMRLTRHCVLVGNTGAVMTVVAGNPRRMRHYRLAGGRR